MDIKIERPTLACAVCTKAFADGETLTTALRTANGSEFSRTDICAACWPTQDAAGFYCFWSNTFAARRKSPLLDPDVLWQVLHKALARVSSDPGAAEFAYVAALGLMRLKHLVLEDAAPGGKRGSMRFRTRGKDREYFEVPDTNLDETGIERIQDNLGRFAADM